MPTHRIVHLVLLLLLAPLLASAAHAACADPPRPFVNWRGCDKTGAQLQDADLRGADLWGATLTRARLDRAQLNNARLRDANLSGAFLPDANLQRADLRNANLSAAWMPRARFVEAVLSAARLDSANLDGARFENAQVVSANFQRAFMDNADLSRANFSGSDMTGVRGQPRAADVAFWGQPVGSAPTDHATCHDGRSNLLQPDGICSFTSSQGCVPDATTLCLDRGRFAVKMVVTRPGDIGRFAEVTERHQQWGTFRSIGGSSVPNTMLTISRRPTGKWSVQIPPLQAAALRVTVDDMVTRRRRTYSKPQGNLGLIIDPDAFPQ